MATSVLDYEQPRVHRKPRRLWVLILFLAVVAIGELMAVPRLYRWPWPLPGDYLLAGLLLAGAAVMALFTSLPGWQIGLYGIVGACFFYPGQTITRDFRFGIAEPGAVQLHVVGWASGVLVVWVLCRSSVLLRRLRLTT